MGPSIFDHGERSVTTETQPLRGPGRAVLCASIGPSIFVDGATRMARRARCSTQRFNGGRRSSSTERYPPVDQVVPVATGVGGYRFHRHHRDPGTRPVAPAWSLALVVTA